METEIKQADSARDRDPASLNGKSQRISRPLKPTRSPPVHRNQHHPPQNRTSYGNRA